ncbi:MAG: SRPBCC domain-containing protein [Planctomycetota bacterium]|nr:SRPBCC domain-containing protein [Planctomycetota bacterium]
MQYKTAITINAAPSAIWKVLTKSEAYPDWEPNTTKIDGRIAEGAKITLHTKLSSRPFPLKVTKLKDERCMVWTGGMPLGLFKGERTFSLTPNGETTEFSMIEEFSGLLSFLITKTIPDLTESFKQFAEALKKQAEAP